MHRYLVAALAAVVAVSSALAAEEPIIGSRENWPTELTRRPLVLDQGMVELYVPAAINVSENRTADTVTSNPSLYLGLTDRWMIGVRHFVGICLGDDADDITSGVGEGCDRFYNDVSVDSVFSLGRTAGLEVAIGLAVNVAPIDPAAWSGEARLIAKAGGGAVALTVAPTINFGLNDREGRGKWAATSFNLGTYNLVALEPALENKEFLLVPATIQLQLGPNLALVAAASLDGPLNGTVDFGDDYRVPVAAAAVLTPIPWIDLGASFTFANLLGKNDTTDARTLGFFAAFRI
jgi:hypothetical protein